MVTTHHPLIRCNFWDIEKVPDQEVLIGVCNIMGISHHARFIRMKDDSLGVQHPVNDPDNLCLELRGLLEQRLRTVQLPGFEGDYVVSIISMEDC